LNFLTRLLPSFLIAWLLSFTLASLFHSQYVVNQLVNVGVAVSLDDRVRLILDDWQGLLLTYGVIIAVALTLAFLTANWLNGKVKQSNELIFTLAGIGAFAIVLIIIESMMNINIIAGARGSGFYAQLASGAAGGFIFAKITNRLGKTNSPKDEEV